MAKYIFVKYKEAIPVPIPKMIKKTVSLMVNFSVRLKLKSKSSPKKKYDVNTDEIDAINNGNNDAKVKSKLNTSTAKTIAAIGDLNIDAIAPADAHAIRRVLVFRSICNNLLKLELIAEPEVIAGPNKPTEPPKPTVNGAAING
ncbi:hypothetical protein GCM10011531_23170 [Aquaticitalea lipolytica]|uniref:Uncharacterized protein n=1 Tax=Aquaticitalea lipolytica TaxID=1247562 RepID=A0A8J2TSN3_9FLAO|nr:hypothetical protein GCM10011531_23170 [Aquaticitalea lipolytica]